jgi:hypothetical protein
MARKTRSEFAASEVYQVFGTEAARRDVMMRKLEPYYNQKIHNLFQH